MNMLAVIGWELRVPVLLAYILIAVTWMAVLPPSDAGTSTRRGVPAFVAVSLIAICLLRLPLIALNAPLNPDEALLVAGAMKLRENFNSWSSVDMGSAGPLNAIALAWPFLFGADTGFAVARITATALLGGTWLLFWGALASVPAWVRIGIGAALILFLGGEQTTDFVHFSTELVPLFLLMAATVVVLCAVDRSPGPVRIGIAGLCLGSVPFAKLQGVPIAFALGLVLLWQVVRQGCFPYRRAQWLVLCACLPAILVLVPLALAGGLQDFWLSYVVWARNYVGSDWNATHSARILPHSFLAMLNILRTGFVGGLVGMLSLVTVLAIVVLSIWNMARTPAHRRAMLRDPFVVRFFITLMMAGLGVLVTMVPGQAFAHYAHFLIWPMGLLAAMATSLAGRCTGLGCLRRHRAVGAMAVVVVGVLAIRTPPRTYDPQVVGAEGVFSTGEALPQVRDGRGHMLVWGWMAQFYVSSGVIPATRDIIAFNQILPSPSRDYFRNRMMNELRADPPDYIVDTVGRGDWFFSNTARDGMQTFKDLARFVADRYVLLSSPAESQTCPRLYARKAIADELDRRYARPVRIHAIPESAGPVGAAAHVADNLVFGNCDDAWLPPSDGPAEVTMELSEAQPLVAIEILNTRGGHDADRASQAVRVMAYRDGALVLDQEARMRRFPYLTQIIVPGAANPIDRVRVRVESHAGIGGGIAEIRMRRE